jgi:hypothetical protein
MRNRRRPEPVPPVSIGQIDLATLPLKTAD